MRKKKRCQGLTLLDVLVIVVVVALLEILLVPTLLRPHRHAQYVNCINNLKQLGLAYRIWEGDNNDKYPMELSVTNGGTMELLPGTDAWKTYQVMSNELNTPKIVYCPDDKSRTAATNFGNSLKNKISYFIGYDACETQPQSWLAGDANLVINGFPIKSRTIEFGSNSVVDWDLSRHVDAQGSLFKTRKSWGNVCFGDGSVQSLNQSNITNCLAQTGFATNRLAIP